MGKSRRKDSSSEEEEVVTKHKGKRKIIYVDEDQISASPTCKRNVKRGKKYVKGKGKGKVRYVYSSSESDSDSQEIVVKKRSKHKVRHKKELVSDSEVDVDDSSGRHEVGRHEVGVKRKNRYETATDTDGSDEVEVIVKKRNKSKAGHQKQAVRGGVSLKSLHSSKFDKISKASTSNMCADSLLPRHQVLRPNNGFGAVTEISSDTYYRSNIQGAITRIKILTFKDEHLRALKMTPFWCLFEVLRSKDEKVYKNCHKNEHDIRQIVDTFDCTAKRFAIGNRLLALTRTDLELIFGISCGDLEIVLEMDKHDKPEWLLRCFGDIITDPKRKFVMYRNLIYEKLKELLCSTDHEDVKDCARLVTCYILISVLAPLQAGSMSWRLSHFMEEFEQMCMYDWSGYIIGLLKEQLDTTSTMKSGGCSIILPFWLCEHTQLIKREDEVSFPRLLNWNLNDLHKVLSRVELGRIPKVYKECSHISKNEMNVLLELKMYRDSNSMAYVRGAVEEEEGVDGDDRDNSQYVAEDGDEEMCTAPSSEALNVDGLRNDEEERSPIREFDQPRSEMVESRINGSTPLVLGVTTPPFSLGLTQNDGDGQSVNATESVRFVSSLRPHDGPSSSKMKGSHQTENVADEEQLDQKVAALEMQVEQVKKELEDDRIRFESSVREKDELIASLRDEKSELLRKLAVFEEGPTTTQLYENQAVMDQLALAEKIAILEQEKRDMLKVVAELTKQAMKNYTPIKQANVSTASEINTSVNCEDVSTITHREDAVACEETVNAQTGRLLGGSSTGVSGETVGHQISVEDEDIERVLETQPGSTILYDNPDNTERSMVCLKTSTPAKTSFGWDGASLDESAEVDKGKGVANEDDPASMIKRVKVRADRKKLLSSPQLNTGEIIAVHEGYTEEEIARDMKLLNANKKNPLDLSISAVKKTLPYLREDIEFYCITKGDRHVVYRGLLPSAEVNISGLLKILHNQRLTSGVIDAWCDLLKQKYAADYRTAKYTLVFSSLCWDLIHKHAGGDSAYFTFLIESQFGKAMDMENLLFPILAGGEDNTMRFVGEHWTLLKLNISKSKWTFYNSKKAKGADHHYKQSLHVVKYVDKKLREVFAKHRPTNKFRQRPLVMPTNELCAQQDPGSKDCGVILCNNVERIMKGKPMLKDQFTLNAAAYYRSKMATCFMQPSVLNDE